MIEEEIERLKVAKKLEEIHLKSNSRLSTFVYLFTVLMSLIISFLVVLLYPIENDEKYCKKDDIKQRISQTIKNGGDITVVKHIYNSRLLEGAWNLLFVGNEDRNINYYSQNVSLNLVLKDLLSDYIYNKESSSDSLYHQNLLLIIEEYNRKNPFDNLDENQKYYFDNIQIKLDSNYNVIHSDMTKIADDIAHKNALISRYLNLSEVSYYISIAALVITIILSLYQIYQNYSSNKSLKKLFSSESDDSKS